jgi:hypothetical protein
MARLLTLISCAIVFTLFMSMAIESGAAAKSHRMLCRATGMNGNQSTWKCSTNQKCCYVWATGKGYCVASSSSCLLNMSTN